jgi:hypothetical protein
MIAMPDGSMQLAPSVAASPQSVGRRPKARRNLASIGLHQDEFEEHEEGDPPRAEPDRDEGAAVDRPPRPTGQRRLTWEEAEQERITYQAEVEAIKAENGDSWLVVLGERNARLRKERQLRAYTAGGKGSVAFAAQAEAAPPPSSLIQLIEGDDEDARVALAAVLVAQRVPEPEPEPEPAADAAAPPAAQLGPAASPVPTPAELEPEVQAAPPAEQEQQEELAGDEDAEKEAWRLQVDMFWQLYLRPTERRGGKLHGCFPCHCVEYGAPLSDETSAVIGFSTTSVFLLREEAVVAGAEEDATIIQRTLASLCHLVVGDEQQLLRLEFMPADGGGPDAFIVLPRDSQLSQQARHRAGLTRLPAPLVTRRWGDEMARWARSSSWWGSSCPGCLRSASRRSCPPRAGAPKRPSPFT